MCKVGKLVIGVGVHLENDVHAGFGASSSNADHTPFCLTDLGWSVAQCAVHGVQRSALEIDHGAIRR